MSFRMIPIRVMRVNHVLTPVADAWSLWVLRLSRGELVFLALAEG